MADARKCKQAGPPIDFAFLDNQTSGDADLRREVLHLFVAQACRIVPSLLGLDERSQADAVHLLMGSALGIGAFAAAETAERYVLADRERRLDIAPDVVAAFDAAVKLINAHFDDTRP